MIIKRRNPNRQKGSRGEKQIKTMKKVIVVLVVIILNNFHVLSQEIKDSINFKESFIKEKEGYFKQDIYKVLNIPIKVSLNKNDSVLLEIEVDSSKFYKKLYIVEKKFWVKKNLKKKNLIILIKNDSAENKNGQFFKLTLTTKDTVVISNNTLIVEIDEYKYTFNPIKTCKYAIGANFDFADGIKPNSFYAEISTFQPNLKKIINKSFGFYGGVYQNRNLSPDSIPKSIQSYSRIKNDTLAISESIKRKPNVVLNNIGFYFGIMMNLLEGYPNDKEFNMYGSLYVELIHQRRTTNYTYTTTSSDTIPLSEVPNNLPPLDRIKSKEEINNNYYIGVGFPIVLKDKDVELSFRPTFGGSWYTGYSTRVFYLYQFSIIEKKYGICFKGEYRGNFGQKETLLSISLSKMFDLSKLIEYK